MKELREKRRINSKTFDLGGGKHLLRTGVGKPLHFVNAQGKLEDIDLTPALNRGQQLIAKAPYTARIGGGFLGYRYTGAAGAISAELVAINGTAIAAREPEYEGRRFFWPNISLDTDLSIIPRNGGIAALVTLHSANAPRSITWELLGSTSMMRPIVGRDANGHALELEQSWDGDRLTVLWTGNVLHQAKLRRGDTSPTEAAYPVWIDPTVNEAIVAGGDDVSSNGFSFLTNNTVIKAGAGTFSTAWYAGFRFQTVTVPQGATIDSATLTLDVIARTGSPSTRIYGADVDNAAAWNSFNRPKNITKTTAFAAFAPGATGTSAVGVTSIMQEIVDRTGWTTTGFFSNVAFAVFNLAAASNYASIAALEHATRQEAQLDITYNTGGGGGDAGGGGILIGL